MQLIHIEKQATLLQKSLYCISLSFNNRIKTIVWKRKV